MANNLKKKGEIERYEEETNPIEKYGELLSEIQDRDFDEKDIRIRFKLLTELAINYSSAFIGSEREDIKLIRKNIRILDGKTSNDLAKKAGYKVRSTGYEDIKKIINETNNLLDNLFDIIYERILIMKMLFTRLNVLGNVKMAMLKAISDAGGNFNLSANTEEVQDAMNSVDDMMKNTLSVLKNPELLEDKDIFRG